MRKLPWVAGAIGCLAAGLMLFASWQSVEAQGAKRPIDRDPVEIVQPPWKGMRVGFEILADGKPMSTVHHAGKIYLPVAKLGQEYAIRVTNHGPRRIVAMVSVDGLSVINGQPASEDHPGYVVAPRGSVVIKGWRRNMETVAAFSFEERDKSYASRIGRPDNIGVIGLIAIEEAGYRPRPMMEKSSDRLSGAQRALPDVGGTGTGYGRDVNSPIYYVSFVRSNNKRTFTYYYDTVEALRSAGVPVDRPRPEPFPADHEFAPPPPGDPRK